MTQQPGKNSAEYWLITPPDDQRLIEHLTVACRGNDKISILLYHLINTGANVMRRTGLQKETAEYVCVEQPLDDMAESIRRLRGKISKTTIKTWMEKLEEWKFVEADGYHQRYKVFFRRVKDAIEKPPEKEKPKPRGPYAHRQKTNSEDHNPGEDHKNNQRKNRKDHKSGYTNTNSENTNHKNSHEITELTTDHSNNNEVNSVIRIAKTVICAQDDEVNSEILLRNALEEISNLRSQISELTFEINKLTFEIENLRSSESSSLASQAALQEQIDSLKKVIERNSNKEISKKESNADASDDQSFPPKSPSRKNKNTKKPEQPVTQSELPQEPEKQEPVLSERGEMVFGEWCKMPWFKGVPPKKTEKVIENCEKLAKYDPLPTADEMLKTRHWYQRKYPNHKGWHLGNVVDAYPQYLSENYKPGQSAPSPAPAAPPSQMDEAQAQSLASKAITMAKGHDHEIQALADGNKVIVRWNTPYFDKPQAFTSETQLLDAFQDMTKLWDASKKKLSRKAI